MKHVMKLLALLLALMLALTLASCKDKEIGRAHV